MKNPTIKSTLHFVCRVFLNSAGCIYSKKNNLKTDRKETGSYRKWNFLFLYTKIPTQKGKKKMKNNFTHWLKAASIRAVKTIAQTAIASIGVSATIGEINWLTVASTAAVSGILSVLPKSHKMHRKRVMHLKYSL